MKDFRKNKERFIDFSNLPHKKIGNNYVVDWYKSKDYNINFIYNGISGTITIKDILDDKYLLITIPEYVENYKISRTSLYKCSLGIILNKINISPVYKIGDIVNNKIILDINDGHKHIKRSYKVKCLSDNYEWTIREDHLINNSGCPVCSGRVANVGVNDIYTLHPELVHLFKYEEDAKNNTSSSGRKATFICPYCGNEQASIIGDVINKGFKCHKCGDGISYPNKYMHNLVDQITNLKKHDNEFICEHTFNWSKNVCTDYSSNKTFIYDIYIPYMNMIIENHGEQHYRDTTFTNVEYQHNNDIYKKSLALKNGIDYYFEINCSKSNSEYIRHSVLSSGLLDIFNLSENQIDWDSCDYYASTNSRLRKVCEIWNNTNLTFSEIARKTNMYKSTVRNYIYRGNAIGLITRPYTGFNFYK